MIRVVVGTMSRHAYLVASLKKALIFSVVEELSFENAGSSAVVIDIERRLINATKFVAALKFPTLMSVVKKARMRF